MAKHKPPYRTHDEVMNAFLSGDAEARVYLELSIGEYLENGDIKAFMLALRQLAQARGGIAKLSSASGLSRESLYKTLSSKGNPQFRSVLAIIHSLGLKIRLESAPARRFPPSGRGGKSHPGEHRV